MSENETRAVVVGRVSTRKQASGWGMQRQIEIGKKYANERGWTVVKTIEQVGSAVSSKLAEEAIVNAREVGARWIIYEQMDRLMRGESSIIPLMLCVYGMRAVVVHPSQWRFGRWSPIVHGEEEVVTHEEYLRAIWGEGETE